MSSRKTRHHHLFDLNDWPLQGEAGAEADARLALTLLVAVEVVDVAQ